MTLKDWEDFADPPLQLKVGGRVYTIPPVGIREGMALSGVTNAVLTESDAPDADEPIEKFYLQMFGQDLWDRLQADNVPSEAVGVMARTAFADYLYGRDAAVAVWEAKGDPEAAGRVIAAQSGPATPRKTRRAAANTTTASGTGTSTATTTRPRKPAAKRSPTRN